MGSRWANASDVPSRLDRDVHSGAMPGPRAAGAKEETGMHRPFASFIAVATIACPWMNQALAQNPAAYDTSYDEHDEYNDPDAPYDDYDAEQPYDDEQYGESSEQPVNPAVGSIDTFHSELAPYGTWIQSTQFGLIWVPSRAVVGTNFMPYATGGSWQYTNVGWMFASDWRWGWATFHYGRWYRDPGHGWCWIPGSVWAPAWVNWRYGGGVVGWAPLPPRHHRTVWVFASASHMNRRHIDRYVYRDSARYHRTTAPVRHRVRSGSAYWYSGPRRDQIERAAKIRIRPIRLQPPRAGVVASVRVEAGRVHRTRVAAPRDRVITRSRREALRARPAVRRVPERGKRLDVQSPRATPRTAPATRQTPRAAPARTAPPKPRGRSEQQRKRVRQPDRR